MFNQNNNNNVMGYLCSTKNVEGFYNTLIDNTPSANKGNVQSKDNSAFWQYLGTISIVSAITNESNHMIKLKFNDNNGDRNKKGLNNLVRNFGVSAQLPFIFHFLDGASNKAFVIRTANWSVSGNELSLTASKSNGIVESDFVEFKKVGNQTQLRVGVFDINNGSQRQGIESKFN
jgi:hypothetical protein